jgi:hypothetical protein
MYSIESRLMKPISPSRIKLLWFNLLQNFSIAGNPQSAFEIPLPFRPLDVNGSLSGMCEERHIDFIAACEGKISWCEYFEKWCDENGPSMEPQ